MKEMTTFKATEDYVRVLGRSIFRDGIRYLSYSCSAVEFMFTGTNLTADIWTDWKLDEEWQWMFKAYMAVIIDDNDEEMNRFPIESGTNTYSIFESDTVKTVKIRIMKMSEAAFSKTGIISINANGNITPTECKPIGIEFIGDSITCGYGNEGVWNTDSFSTKQENPWKAYAASTARQLDMEFELISWSGIGVISSWVDDDKNGPNNEWLMPELYDYTDRGLDNALGNTDDDKKEKWGNEDFCPQICVINLGTNDNSYTKQIPERVSAFGERYIEFLRKIRNTHPEAYIICTLGAMGQDLFPEIEKRVKEINDIKISCMPFDVQLEADGIGADWHPSLITHQKMTEKLVSFIKTNCKLS